MCVEKLQESGQVPETTNFDRSQMEKSSDLAQTHVSLY